LQIVITGKEYWYSNLQAIDKQDDIALSNGDVIGRRAFFGGPIQRSRGIEWIWYKEGIMGSVNAHALLLVQLPLVALLAGCSSRPSSEYGLPITLGSSSHDVQSILGRPDRILKTGDVAENWYYPSGLFTELDHDRVFEIELYTFCDIQGFLLYSGPVVHGVTLTDSKGDILRKLGKPTKIETDPPAAPISLYVPEDCNSGEDIKWDDEPSESRYYWRYPDYTVRARFLNEAQKVSDTVAWPKDGLISILVKR
jgi:hypothetical protein